MVASTALLAPATTAMAAPAFAITAISGIPAAITAPKAVTEVPFTVTFTGPATSSTVSYRDSAADYSGASVTTLGSRVASPSAPYISTSPSTLTPDTPATFGLTVSPYTTPGRYRITVPITLRTYVGSTHTDSTQTASVDFDYMANPEVTQSSSFSSWDLRGKYSKKSKWTAYYSGPSYVSGSHFQIYYKANGKKTYKKVADKWVNASGDVPSFKLKKGAITKKGMVYYVLTAVPWAPLLRSWDYKLVTRY